MISTITHTAIDAVIYLKNGKRKYGVLIDQTETNENYQFISNYHLGMFRETNNPGFIELLSGASIEAIDINLK
ncbi:MAG: hypothetical protein M3R27_09370 [Bacteroidota bacterium]|nr:hypothetical protein [Bacteroidota bacterium]